MSTEILYHKTIDSLPLNKFIDCIVDGNLSALTISGFPNKDELNESWQNILSEYTDAIGSSEHKMFINLWKEVEEMNITLKQINFIAAKGSDTEPQGILRVHYDDFFAKELNTLLKTNYRLNWDDQKSYHAELDKCINRSKAIFIKLELKKASFNAIQKKNAGKGNEKLDRKYFTSVLITLSDHAKYRLEDNMKVSEYCERVKRFSEYCEQLTKKKT